MASAEEDFPRGGRAKKSTGSKTVVHRTEADNLFQVDFNFHPFLSVLLSVKRIDLGSECRQK